MKMYSHAWLALLVFATPLFAASLPSEKAGEYGTLPLSFEENKGQTDPRVRFLSRGPGYTLFLTNQEAVLAFGHKASNSVIRLRLSGANQDLAVKGTDQLPGTANYFIGNDSAKWHSALATYQMVRYANVYHGVDLLYYGNHRELEYDFTVAPQADAKQIKLHFDGARQVRIEPNGDLRIISREGELAFHKPVIYQEFNGQRQAVRGQFKLIAKNTVGFKIGSYDRSKELVIDPTLAYSTFLGGSTNPGGFGTAITVDSGGNAYVVGTTYSTDFPNTAGAVQPMNNSRNNQVFNAFVSKLNPAGTALIYSTYLGGSGNVPLLGTQYDGDYPDGMAIDSSGNAYIAGTSFSTDFPTTSGAFQGSNKAGASGGSNGFISKLNATGTQLIYSTYLGGSTYDGCSNIAIDAAGNAYLSGSTASFDFPVTGGVIQPFKRSLLFTNAFVTKLNRNGSALVYSTYLGGTSIDTSTAIAVDNTGDAYVAGFTVSSDFPTTPGAFQTSYHAANGYSNGFVFKLNPTASNLIYSTYLGGSGNPNGLFLDGDNGDSVEALAVDSAGNAYVSGTTQSNDFPVTSGAFQTTNLSFASNLTQQFVSKINPSGSALVYSTYIGGTLGSGQDGLRGLAIDTAGNAFITGITNAYDFPVTANAFQSSNICLVSTPSGVFPGADAFVTELNATGTGLLYSSYLGGTSPGVDLIPGTLIPNYVCANGYGIALDPAGNAYVTGVANSSDFPTTTGAFQTSKTAPNAAFITKFAFGSTTTRSTITTLTADVNPQLLGNRVTFTASVASASGGSTPTGSIVFGVDGMSVSTVPLDATGHAKYSTITLAQGTRIITATYSGDSTYLASTGTFSENIINTVTVSFAVAPVGAAYSVDGTIYATAQALTLVNGSTHTVSAVSPQRVPGTMYTFKSWSDGGAQSHTITASPGASFTVIFNVSYQLITAASPAVGGSVSPVSGGYYPAGTVVPITATPNSGFSFSHWSGNILAANSPTTGVIMGTPQTVTAVFVPSGSAALFGNIIGKSGPASASIWSLSIGNSGSGVASGAAVSGFSVFQTAGAACSPTVTSALPLFAGNLTPGALTTVAVTLNFAGCAPLARFTVDVSLSANAGAATGSIVRFNQFQ